MNHNKHKRILLALLACILLLSCMPVLTMAEGSGQAFAVTQNNEVVSQVTFAKNEKPVVTAVNIPGGYACQWQICVPGTDTWVDIHGQTGENLTLSYALLGSLLDSDGTAVVRCAAVSQGSETFYTDTVRVTVTEAVAPTETEETTRETGSEGGLEALASQFSQNISFGEPGQMNETSSQAEGEEDTDALADGDIVTVTIQYLYWDRLTDTVGDMVWSSYVAYIEKGTDFSATVANKTVPGYKAVLAEDNPEGATRISNDTGTTVDSEYTGPTSIKLELTEVKEDITFTVYYKEILVNYYARYYLQNITNDLYTEDTDQYGTFQGYQGAQPSVDAVNKTIAGFTSMFYQPDKIAADGSTVFEVYYDRNYYLINFELDGGYGTSPVYARYQTTFTVAEPTRPGYVFAGWKLVLEDGKPVSGTVTTLPSTIPAHNQTYQAVWTTVTTEYTVVYWRETSVSGEYSYWGSTTKSINSSEFVDGEDDISSTNISKITSSENIVVDESNFYTFNETLSDKNVRVEGDGSTIVNVYYDRNEYTLKFYYAMQTTDDQNQYLDGHQHIYVIGGSTYYFGSAAGTESNGDDIALLSQYMMSSGTGHRGTVLSVPQLNASGNAKGYTMGTEKRTVGTVEYTYYYLSFTAEYNDDISTMWPCDVFEAAERADMSNDYNGWDGKYAYASAWNGEHHVYYSQRVGNQTIKGKYQKLDYKLLWDASFGQPEDNTVSYLCFWENGTEAYNLTWSVPKLWYYRLWLPVLAGEDTNNLTLSTDGKYKLIEHYATCDNSGLGDQTCVTMEGYSEEDRKQISGDEAKTILNGYGFTDTELGNYKEYYIADFYYMRNSYSLSFDNYSSDDPFNNSVEVSYGASISEWECTPTYPRNLEVGSHQFAGWYTSPEFATGTEVAWDSTMPAGDVNLYAKWVPVTHTVQFYLDYDALTTGEQYGSGYEVDHGKVMDTPSDISLVPTHENSRYRFVQWFYIKDGKKVAFEPSTMTVQQDLKLYAEWTSSQVTDYTVRYAKADENGDFITDSNGDVVYIAEPTTGYAFEATTKTFAAKSVEQLNLLPEDEQDQLWLPLTNSHSILMKEESDTYQNEFTFGYVTKDNAPYTVQYVDSSTGTVLRTKTVGQNQAAVVTEQFVYIEGYIPDAFYKQLVLSATDAENVITFYYTKETTEEPADPDNPDPGDTGTTAKRTLYLVTHYIQDLDGEGYTEYKSDTYIETVGTYVTGTEITISGFTYDPDKTTATGPDGEVTWDDENNGYLLGEDGIELKLYYDRDMYAYTVRYLERGTDKTLHEAKNAAPVMFGTVVTEDALSIAGYDLYSNTPQTLTIGIAEDTNVITFYYVAKQITIHYIPVCSAAGAVNFGDVSRNVENPTSVQDISGASAITREGFRFVGWYSDAECTKQVATAKNYTPVLPPDYAQKDIYEFTYYALFEPVQEELIISKQAAAGTLLDTNDSFLFQITGTDVLGNDVNLFVTIQGAGSVTVTGLYCGTYTITELTGWSWTYGCTDIEQTVTISSTDSVTVYTVTFTNTPKTVDWLHGEAYSENEIP